MNYLNVLNKNIEMMKVLEKDYKIGSAVNKGLTYSDIEELRESDKKDRLKLFIADRYSGLTSPLRYVLNNDTLKANVLNADEKYVELYQEIIQDKSLYEKIDSDKLALYDLDLLQDVWSSIKENSRVNRDDISLKIVLEYCAEKGLVDSRDAILEISKFISSSIFNYKEERYEYFIKIVEYALDNSISNLGYNLIEKVIVEDINEDIMSYLQFMSKYEISDINLDEVLSNQNIVKRLDCLIEIGNFLKEENFKYILSLFESKCFSNKEVNSFLYKTREGESLDFASNYNEFYSNVLRFIYPNFKNDSCEKDTLEFYHYLLRTGKKKFLKTISEADYNIAYCCVIKEKYVYEILNLNILTIDQLNSIEKLSPYRSKKHLELFLSCGLKNISFKELELICSLSENKLKVYKYLIDLKPDDRMKLISDLPKLNEARLTDEEVEKLSNLIKEKSITKRIEDIYKSIDKSPSRRLTKNEWCSYFMIEGMDSLKSQVKNELDILFFIDYEDEIRKSTFNDFESIKKDIYLNSREYKAFIKTLSASGDFIDANKDKIYEFFLTRMMGVFLKYKKSLSDKQLTNLVKITKAELSGKLKDIKYYEGDLVKEIGYDISKEKQDIWANNLKSTSGKYNVEEADDYNTVIKMGAIPVDTCMHYDGGSYNYCLLSNFDANKKIIIGKDNNGTILSRAVLRLTKLSDTPRLLNSNLSTDDYLSFKDVEELGMPKSEKRISKNEELVLFLERCYTSANDPSQIRFDMLKLAYIKAQKMGVRLMVASDYSRSKLVNEFKKDMQAKSKSYVYISKSKNGYQYLDSFGGSTTNDSARYVSAFDYTVFLQENMFNSIYETK